MKALLIIIITLLLGNIHAEEKKHTVTKSEYAEILKTYGIRELKILKVYSGRLFSGHIFRSYIVKWDDVEVALDELDPDHMLEKELKAGDVIRVLKSEDDHVVNGEIVKTLSFIRADKLLEKIQLEDSR